MVFASSLACVVGSLRTPPVSRPILSEFYRTVRPIGFWGPIARSVVLPGKTRSSGIEVVRTLGNTVLGMVAIFAFYVSPMYLVGHAYPKAGIWAAVAFLCVFILRYTWYAYLEEANQSHRSHPSDRL